MAMCIELRPARVTLIIVAGSLQVGTVIGNESNMLFRMNIKTELYFIDHQTNNGIMHIIFLRKAKGSSCQPFNPRSQI
jgi:hypothetical protein